MEKNLQYIVSWDERHTITLEAKNKEDAKDKIYKGDYPPENENTEMNGSLKVDTIIIK